MDFIAAMLSSKGFLVIFVVIHRLSKYGHAIPLKDDFTSIVVAKDFITNMVKLRGTPYSIVSDRDKTFTSRFWEHLFHRVGTSLALC